MRARPSPVKLRASSHQPAWMRHGRGKVDAQASSAAESLRLSDFGHLGSACWSHNIDHHHLHGLHHIEARQGSGRSVAAKHTQRHMVLMAQRHKRRTILITGLQPQAGSLPVLCGRTGRSASCRESVAGRGQKLTPTVLAMLFVGYRRARSEAPTIIAAHAVQSCVVGT